MDKFTPGPWIIGTPPPNGELTIGNQAGMMVAVATTGFSCPTAANASLIAAAPDLLEALETCIDYGSMTGGEWVSDKARAAIAKARGES